MWLSEFFSLSIFYSPPATPLAGAHRIYSFSGTPVEDNSFKFSPNSTWLVTLMCVCSILIKGYLLTYHVSTRHVRRVERVVTSVSRRAVRQARHVSSRLFPMPKWNIGSVSCRDATWRAKWNLGFSLWSTVAAWCYKRALLDRMFWQPTSSAAATRLRVKVRHLYLVVADAVIASAALNCLRQSGRHHLSIAYDTFLCVGTATIYTVVQKSKPLSRIIIKSC